MAATTPTGTMRKVVWNQRTSQHSWLYIPAIQIVCLRGLSTIITYNADTWRVECADVEATALSSRVWDSYIDELIPVLAGQS
jgi:hypothetical protein